MEGAGAPQAGDLDMMQDSSGWAHAPPLPTDAEFIDSIDPFRSRREVPVLALTEEQIRALPVPQRPAPVASAAEGPIRTYPPLEPRG